MLEDGEVFVVEHYVVCGVFRESFAEGGERVYGYEVGEVADCWRDM